MVESREGIEERIAKGLKDAVLYRRLNIALFNLSKFGVPALSALVTVGLTMATSGNPILSQGKMALIGAAILILSGIDVAINPSQKKVLAYETRNAIEDLRDRFRADIHVAKDDGERAEVCRNASRELKAILDNYARQGWGN